MRKHYLDNIRWGMVVLVLIYHVFYLFNSVGVLGGVGGFLGTPYQDFPLYFVYPWMMVILFVVAGVSARFALESRLAKQFVKERTAKLLVPSTLGLVAIQWIVGYFNLKSGGAWDQLPAFLRYPVMVLSGVGPLWFIQMLWVFSLLLVLIRKIDRGNRLLDLGSKCPTYVVLLLFLPVWGASQILNAPVITTYRFGIYFLSFLIGYAILSHESVLERIERIRIPLLCTAIPMGIAYSLYYFGTDYTADACLKHIFTNVYLWTAVLAILGCGKAWLNRTSKFETYMTKSSFGIYILHYLVVLPICWLLKTKTALPAALMYLVAIAAVLILPPILNEGIRRVPVLRYLVLGVRKKRPAAAGQNARA